MSIYAGKSIHAATAGEKTFCKFLSANDTGVTGAHQSGIYIPKTAVPILFDRPGERGEMLSRWVKVQWMGNEFDTEARFIYYGQKTRNEYRITHFGSGFPFLRPEYTGALFVFVQDSPDDYQGFVLNEEEDINEFLDTFGLSPADTNRLIETDMVSTERKETEAISKFIASLSVDFPTSEEMSAAARSIETLVYDHEENVRIHPDRKLVDWTNMEYRLFRELEYARYGEMIKKGFASVDDFINVANQVLNRRKSRAGKSLEHHLSAIFDANGIIYTPQAVTEGNKKPDFLFPSQEAYRDSGYPVERLVSLAAKTTCKDRWRQILNEADRLRDRPKYLCTLQQGMSPNQMDEMAAENVILVVPKDYLVTYPLTKRNGIWTVERFVLYVKSIEKV